MNWLRSLNKRLSPRVEWISFDEHLVLIRDEREIIVLNETARHIWEAFAEGATVADLVSDIADRFGLSSARAQADVETALAEWRGRGLLEDDPPTRPWTPRRPGGAPPPTGFAADLTYALCGYAVRFRFQDLDAEDLIRPLLAPAEVIGPAAHEVIDLYRDGADHVIAANGAEIGRSPLTEDVLGLALGRVLEVSYPDAHWLAMFHAGVVADDRHAIVLPGASGSGKSTLTAALVHAGFRYLSDDVAPLDGRTLAVMPMPFAVSLKRGSWGVLAPWFPDLERVPAFGRGWRSRRYLDMPRRDGDTRGSGAPVKALVFPQHRSDGPTQIAQIRPGEALGRLLQAGGWVSLDRQDLSNLLAWLMSTPGYKIAYNSTQEARSSICDLSSSLRCCA